MIVRSIRPRRIGIAAALIAGGALLAPAAANAAPVSPTAPVPGTSCNVGQVERATAKVAPEFWQHVSQKPQAKDRFEQFLVQTDAERKAARDKMRADHKAKVEQWKKDHPGQTMPMHTGKDGKPMQKPTQQQIQQRKADFQKKIAQIKSTCATS